MERLLSHKAIQQKELQQFQRELMLEWIEEKKKSGKIFKFYQIRKKDQKNYFYHLLKIQSML